MAVDQRVGQIELCLHNPRPVLFELTGASTDLAKPLALAHEPTHLGLE